MTHDQFVELTIRNIMDRRFPAPPVVHAPRGVSAQCDALESICEMLQPLADKDDNMPHAVEDAVDHLICQCREGWERVREYRRLTSDLKEAECRALRRISHLKDRSANYDRMASALRATKAKCAKLSEVAQLFRDELMCVNSIDPSLEAQEKIDLALQEVVQLEMEMKEL